MSINTKSYYDFMSEITPTDLYAGLLAYGMFSEKLPPIFTSKPFFTMYKPTPPHSKGVLISMFIMRI